MGAQLELEIAGGDLETPVTLTRGATDFLGYKVALGGEKWLSKALAFRTGLSFHNGVNSGAEDYRLEDYSILVGQRIVATTITMGLGLREEAFRGDLMASYGQPSLYDSVSPEGFASQVILQFSAGIFFK
jgi:hypothetical protein